MVLSDVSWDYYDYLWRNEPYETLLKNNPTGSALFQKMLSLEPFQKAYVERFSVFLGDFLQPDNTMALFEKMYDEIAVEHQRLIDFYNISVNLSQSYNNRLEFLRRRPAIIYEQLARHYDLGDTVRVTLDRRDRHAAIYGTTLSQPIFNGCFYSGKELELSTHEKEADWIVEATALDGSVTTTIYGGNELRLDLAGLSRVDIKLGDGSGIGNIWIDHSPSSPQPIYDLQGRYAGTSFDALSPGLYIISGRKILKK
ncbi:MAG: hypothetical protein LIO90_05775 [Bacteroidales bacterium]|nr:hypothetical protein [Bacteroidales bacterium]